MLLLLLISCMVEGQLVPDAFTRYPPMQKCSGGSKVELVTIPRHLMSNNQTSTFRLTEKCPTRLPHCMGRCGSPLATLPLPLLNSTEELAEIQFTPYGYFRYGSSYFAPQDVCVDSVSAAQLVVSVCPPSCFIEERNTETPSVCVPKCCSIHKALDVQSDSCRYTNSSAPWAPPVYRDTSGCRERHSSLKLHYVQTQPHCAQFNKYFLRNLPGMDGWMSTRVIFRLLRNGTVVLRDIGDNQWKVLGEGTYCLDGVILRSAFTRDHVLVVCDGEWGGNNRSRGNAEEDRWTVGGILYIVLLFSGVPFLLVTALVYLLVWGDQNVHGWTLFSHTLAMLLHYVAQAVANTVARIFDSSQSASAVCMSVGILNHYFVLASFCWLTIINYDLFSMFRHLRTTVGRSRGLNRFLVYMGLAWGVPFVVVIVSVVLDQVYGINGEEDMDCQSTVVVPLYGHRTCYIAEDARPYYLYYPVLGLVVVNVGLAGLTCFSMYGHEKQAGGVLNKDCSSSRTRHRGKFSVMAKLFVVMGLVWVFEVFVWCFQTKGETLPWYLVFPDVFNVVQAVAVFWLFACQEKVLGQVETRFPALSPATMCLRRLACRGGGGGQQQRSSSNDGGRGTDSNSAVKT